MESQTGSSVFPIPGDNNSDYEALYQELQTKTAVSAVTDFS